MEKKLITEMKFMMERLENPRMTYTEYEKKHKFLTEAEMDPHNFTQEPEIITVKFNGDGFMDHYWTGTEGDKVYQAHGFASNLKNLEEEGHHNYGDGGLEMRKGYYYPLFKVFDRFDKENSKNSFWYYIVYSGDEINITQSSEHSDQGIDISNSFNSLKNITRNWYCKFDKGVTPGARDHKGFFEIVSVR